MCSSDLFLGAAGLLLVSGARMLWYPVGWTAGFLVVLVLVAAPLRRSGAYTLPDFAEARLGSRTVRSACSALVVVLGWLYLLPQFQGAGLTLQAAVGAPARLGPLVIGGVVLVNVCSGGMRSITLVQAFQYWLKLVALLVPITVVAAVWWHAGRPETTTPPSSWSDPVAPGGIGLYTTYSLILATFLGTMGLPHVIVRFYTNPDGRAARRTTLTVVGLLGLFYVVPPAYAALGRVYAPDEGSADSLVLRLPHLVLPGIAGDVLTGLVTAGAFAAFLSTSSGLTIALAGVIGQSLGRHERLGRLGRLDGIGGFRVGATLAVVVPVAVALVAPDLGLARAVGLAFALAASTFAPLLTLGIWWRGLTDLGALAGLAAGAAGSAVALAGVIVSPDLGGWAGALLGQPAAWTCPLAFAVMVTTSLATRRRVRPDAARILARLHRPEERPGTTPSGRPVDRSPQDADRPAQQAGRSPRGSAPPLTP
mgnify:CR=1 FL=1